MYTYIHIIHYMSTFLNNLTQEMYPYLILIIFHYLTVNSILFNSHNMRTIFYGKLYYQYNYL